MATVISNEYLGDHQVKLTHGPTGDQIVTDLPPDNDGKGRTFSPTDLFAASLSSCILTIMGKVATRDGLNLKGTTIDIEKIMNDSPRRVGKFIGKIKFPEEFSAKDTKKMMACVSACPVHKSLHPDIEVIFDIVQ
jgi:putative redox protein